MATFPQSSEFEIKSGSAVECLSLQLQLVKEPVIVDGVQHLYSGLTIAGGIDQDFRQSKQGYSDNGVYITQVAENSPASNCGLMPDDKILSSNGFDFTLCTHKAAVEQIKKHSILNLLIARKGVTHD